MNWSPTPPTEPGWYQYRAPDASAIVFYRIEFYRIEQAPTGELVATVDGSLEHVALHDLPGEWRGPILGTEKWQ
jgi:hypothetical protein